MADDDIREDDEPEDDESDLDDVDPDDVEPDDVEPDDIDPDEIDADDFEPLDDDELADDDELEENAEEEEEDEAAPRRAAAAEEEDDDEDLVDPDDVEADLDTILKDRLVAAEEAPEEDEEEVEVDERVDPSERLSPRRSDEVQCPACFLLIRHQTGVSDGQFLKSMIPHHAAALLMCEEADLSDPEIKRLCEGIRAGQQREIDQMKAILERLGR